MKNERDLLIALNAIPDVSRSSICSLSKDLSWLQAPPQSPGAIAEEAWKTGVPADHLSRARAFLEEAPRISEGEEKRASREGARIIVRGEDSYPEPLEDLELPPPVLYLLGEIPPQPAIAIVGSRKATAYGLEAAKAFASTLAQAGVAVISGFARGIDAAAHEAAVKAPQGRTVAVLGCGLSVPYPKGNARLREHIAGKGGEGSRGGLVSELPMGREPRPWHFPVRNRLIAALAGGTLVIQATVRSGSLITAHHALELGREIYALPGSVFHETSRGPHSLIRDGATLVHRPEQILETLQPARRLPLDLCPAIAPPPRPLPAGLPGKLLGFMPEGEERSPDDLATASGLPMHQLLSTLLDLELNGWCRRLPGPLYRRSL